jgi:cobalamin biosynthetic protein CobC
MLEHGGNLHDAVRLFGRPREDWLDLSTGINPRPYPAPALEASIWHRLPEPDAGLAAAARQLYGAPLVLPVAGSQAAIQALPLLRQRSRIVVAAPAYAEHARHWSRHGHAMREVAYRDLHDAVEDCDVMVVCNPNNPTGERIPAATLLAWAQQLARRGGWLVVDEAFADVDGQDGVAAQARRPGLVVLRSIGKFFGLAGLRLGFVAAEASLLARLSDALGPWTVSSAAQHIGRAALEDVAWQQATRQQLRRDGQRLQAMLRAAGIVSGGTALYQWWPESRAELFWRTMAGHGIWVRLFNRGAGGIRCGLPADEAGWRRLETALQAWRET